MIVGWHGLVTLRTNRGVVIIPRLVTLSEPQIGSNAAPAEGSAEPRNDVLSLGGDSALQKVRFYGLSGKQGSLRTGANYDQASTIRHAVRIVTTRSGHGWHDEKSTIDRGSVTPSHWSGFRQLAQHRANQSNL